MKKTIYLDCEFNGFHGELLSMALVPQDPSLPEFYCELEFSGQLDPWVREHVVPHLVLAPVPRYKFQMALGDYLWQLGDVRIVADWPDDIRHLCESLITGPGQMLSFVHNIEFGLDLGIEYTSVVPHNALHDARAIRDSCVSRDAARRTEHAGSDAPANDENDLVYRLRKRAEIRRQIPGRRSVQEGAPDRISEILEEAANEIQSLRTTDK